MQEPGLCKAGQWGRVLGTKGALGTRGCCGLGHTGGFVGLCHCGTVTSVVLCVGGVEKRKADLSLEGSLALTGRDAWGTF